MRLEFYKVKDSLEWDIQENGWSLLGNDYEDDCQVFGFFMNPTIVGENLDKLSSFPISKEQATVWLYSAGFLAETDYVFDTAEELGALAKLQTTEFPSKISMLLSTSNGIQGQRVQDYVVTLRAKTKALNDVGYVSNEYVAPPVMTPYFDDTDPLVAA